MASIYASHTLLKLLGLIDEGENAEETAIRELEEETGFKGQAILDSTPVLVADPGMTNANMKLVMVDVPFKDNLIVSDQKLESGEFITRRVVELSKLADEFKSMSVFPVLSVRTDLRLIEYDEKVSAACTGLVRPQSLKGLLRATSWTRNSHTSCTGTTSR